MINHARTLLMNVAGAPGFNGELGEEIVPPDFIPAALPGSINTLRRTLFGADPDRVMLNYRARQLMQVLHSTPLVEYVTSLDSRITYDFSDDPFSNALLFGARPTQLQGSAKSFYCIGGEIQPDFSGRMRRHWRVQVTGASTATVTSLKPFVSETTSFTVEGGLSSLIQLPAAPNHYVRLGSPEVNDEWMVSLLSRPRVSLGELQASLQLSGGEAIDEVLSTTSQSGEPFSTFRNLWRDHHELAMSLGGLVLAMIYRTEAARVSV